MEVALVPDVKREIRDSAFKIVFDHPELFAQFLQDYVPFIIPMVYYDGADQWTVERNFALKVAGGTVDELRKYIPDFVYELMELRKNSTPELMQKENLLGVILAVDKAREANDITLLSENYADVLLHVQQTTPEHLLASGRDVMLAFLRRINVPREELVSFSQTIHPRRFAEMFAMLKPYDVQETRRIARQEGRKEGRVEGLEEGREEIRMELLARVERLYKTGLLSPDAAKVLLTQYCGEEVISDLLADWDSECVSPEPERN